MGTFEGRSSGRNDLSIFGTFDFIKSGGTGCNLFLIFLDLIYDFFIWTYICFSGSLSVDSL